MRRAHEVMAKMHRIITRYSYIHYIYMHIYVCIYLSMNERPGRIIEWEVWEYFGETIRIPDWNGLCVSANLLAFLHFYGKQNI